MGFLMASPIKNKNGVWTTRLVVPKELRPIVGKSELKRSLGTKEEREARLSHPSVLAEFQAEIERARRKLESNNRLTDGVIETIIFNWKKAVATQFSTNPDTVNPYLTKYNGLVEGNDAAVIQILDDMDNLKHRKQESVKTDKPMSDEAYNQRLLKYFKQLNSVLGEFFDADLASFQVEPDVHSPQYQKLLVNFSKAYIQIAQSGLKKFASDMDLQRHGVSKAVVSEALNTGSQVSFNEVWEEYQQSVRRREPDRAEQRLRDYATSVNKFLKMYPDIAIGSVFKREIAKFRNILEQLPSRPKQEVASLGLEEQIDKVSELSLKVTTPASVKKQIQAISAVFAYAVQQDYIQVNPVHGTTSDIKKVQGGGDKHYSMPEIQTIFGSKLFHDNYGPEKADYGRAHYWLPLMLYYTGARAEELAQLYVDDVVLDDEIPHILITGERDDQSTKTGKRRRVPIHSHLLELGLADYVRSVARDGRLFPKLSKPEGGKYHVKVSLWFGKYLNELGIAKEGRSPFHAFRHTFITGCRERNIRADIQNAITGHSQSDVASQYGAYPLPLMNEVIQAVPCCF